MFFRKSRKLRFDGRRAPHPQVGQIAADLGLEWLEARQLLTAVASTGEFTDASDPSGSDSSNWNSNSLNGPGGSTTVDQTAAVNGASVDSASSVSTPSIAAGDAGSQTGSLSGYVFSESSSDSSDYDPTDPASGESPLAGVTVTLYDNETESNESVVTGLDGSYGFSNLGAGSYTIVATTPPGASGDQVFVGSQESGVGFDSEIDDIQLAAGTNGTQNNFPEIVQPATLAGTVFVEPSLGSPDYDPSNPAAGEMPLPGATVELSTAGGTEIGSTMTDANGEYSFANLAPNLSVPDESSDDLVSGNSFAQPQDVDANGYVLTVVPAAGYQADTAIAAKGSTGTPGTGTIGGIVLGAGDDESGDDFPLVITQPGSLSGYAFSEPEPGSDDYNPADPADGETPLAGVTIDLQDSFGNLIGSTVTGSSGAYNFTGIGPGTYSILEPGASSNAGNDTAFAGSLGGTAGDGSISDIVVGPSAVGTGYDLPEFVAPGGLSGYVFAEQTPGSPAYDPTHPAAGESPLGDMTVTLTNSVGAFVASTQTSSTGAYSFANLEPDVGNDLADDDDTVIDLADSVSDDSESLVRGTYNLSFGALAGYTSDVALVGSQTTGTAGIGSIDGISLDAGTLGTGNDVGEFLTDSGSVTGYVFAETNAGSAAFNPDDPAVGESPLAGATLTLYGAFDQVIATTTTDATGAYSFSGLPAGTYTVVQSTLPSGYTADDAIAGVGSGTSTAIGDVVEATLAVTQQTTGNDFPDLAQPSSLSGVVFAEATAGSPDYNSADPAAGESLLAGATVTLYDSDHNVVGTPQVTGASGTYQFANLAPGVYSIQVTPPSGYANDEAFVGSQSSGTKAAGSLTDVTLAAGTSGTGNDFGELTLPASLSGVVFAEATAGSPDYNPEDPATGESLLAGATVTLYDSDHNVVGTPQVTGASGTYQFANLAPGVYSVQVTPPSGYANDEAFVGSQLSGTTAAGSLTGITLGPGTSGTGNDFGELPTTSDVEITQTDSVGGSSVTGAAGTAVPGTAITYTIVVSNAGPGAATGASIIDALPSTLSSATYTATATGGATGFSQSGTGSVDDPAVDMPAGSTITYTVQATIAPSAIGTLSNTATVAAPDAATDTDNNSATDTDTLTPETDLEINIGDNVGGSSGTGATGTAVPGDGITYTIVVTNAGPSDAIGASVVDTLSNLLTGATYTATGTGGATGFTQSGTGSIDDTKVNLPAGSTVTYAIQATIAPSATGTLSNTATVTPPVGVTDTGDHGTIAEDFVDRRGSAAVVTTDDSSATDTDTLTPEADLEVTKTDNLGGSSITGAIGSGAPGQAITYTIVVTSVGPSDATGVSVVDALPTTLSGATYTATATGGATGFTASGSGSIDDTALNMPVGSTITYTVHATIVSTATGTLSTTTTVTTPVGASHSHTAVSSAADSDKLSAASVTNLGAIDFAVSALLTGNLTVTGSYAPPPVPHVGLPISQTGQPGLQIFPMVPTTSLPAGAVDNVMGATGGGGGDVELVGPQLDLDLTKVNQGSNPAWDMMTNSRTEDWSSDELIGSLLDKLADIDELSLVSFEFGDDVVTPTMRKAQRVTAAKPVVLQGGTGTPASVTRDGSATPELNLESTGGQGNGGASGSGQGTGSGQGSGGGAGAPAPGPAKSSSGASTEQTSPDSGAQGATHGWIWWLGGSVSAGSVGTLCWVLGWRRRGRGLSARRLREV